MPALSVPAAPGFHGWTRLRDGAWKTMLPSDIAEVAAALEADKKDCPSCLSKSPVPHGTTYVHGDTPVSKASAHTFVCRSGSRHFDVATRKMIGRSHCSCDACF